MIYLDWASTTPLHSDVLAGMQQSAQTIYGNPSSIHYVGRQAERQLTRDRESLAHCAGCRPEEVVFTSGATEANNMVVWSVIRRLLPAGNAAGSKNIVVSGIEHPSIYAAARSAGQLGLEVRVVPATACGRIEPAAVEAALDNHTLLVLVMYVNNETGTIQPIREIATLLQRRAGQRRRILLHTDAVQGFGKLPFHFGELGADSASLSAHKIQGPKGTGALLVRKGAGYAFLYQGGEQERGQRPGTENLTGIHGFALAAERACRLREEHYTHATQLKHFFLERLQGLESAVLLPTAQERQSPYIIKMAFPPLPGEVLVRVLEDNGLVVSTGSACSSRQREKQLRVLRQMQVPDKLAEASIRISTGPATTEEELARLAAVLEKEVPALQKLTG